MTTIYRTYAPSGDIDHATPSDMANWIGEWGDDVTRVAKLYYKGEVIWNDEENLASGDLEFAEDTTKTTATMLMASWCGTDDMLEWNPHELVYTHFNVGQMRGARMGEIAEMRGRPSCGGV